MGDTFDIEASIGIVGDLLEATMPPGTSGSDVRKELGNIVNTATEAQRDGNPPMRKKRAVGAMLGQVYARDPSQPPPKRFLVDNHAILMQSEFGPIVPALKGALVSSTIASGYKAIKKDLLDAKTSLACRSRNKSADSAKIAMAKAKEKCQSLIENHNSWLKVAFVNKLITELNEVVGHLQQFVDTTGSTFSDAAAVKLLRDRRDGAEDEDVSVTLDEEDAEQEDTED